MRNQKACKDGRKKVELAEEMFARAFQVAERLGVAVQIHFGKEARWFEFKNLKLSHPNCG